MQSRILGGNPGSVLRGSTRADESGATLLLALMFLAVGSLLVGGLMIWSTNSFKDVAAFKSSRTFNYAANSAMETAISNVRYSTNACPSTGLSITVPGSTSADTLTVQIWCNPASPQSESASSSSRDVTFSACLSSAVASGQCTQANPYLKAEVVYDDYTTGDVATGSACTNHCGENETIKSWTFENIGL